jgi:hypothetical protein
MRLFKITAKYALIFLLVCFVTLLGGSTVISYYTVQTLTQVASNQTESEPNLSAVLKLTGTYLADLQSYEAFVRDINGQNWPAFCSVICNPSSFDKDKYLKERTPYLISFYNQQKKNAPSDPSFRMKIAQMEFLRTAIPGSLRGVLNDILIPAGNPSQTLLSLRLGSAILGQLPSARSLYIETKSQLRKLDELKEIANSCSHNKPKDMIAQCEKTLL